MCLYLYTSLCQSFACGMCGRCCRNDWLVSVDEATYDRSRTLFWQTGRQAEFERVFVPLTGARQTGEYAYIAKQDSGACWFLGGENLCRLQREAGHGFLDTVCQTFPRYPMSTARGLELTLSFSCSRVVELACQIDRLEVLRQDSPPFAVAPDAVVLTVHPQQRPASDPLHYYFEIEQHLLDILQWRGAPLSHRLRLLADTVTALRRLAGDDALGGQLTRLLYRNYDYMDAAGDGSGGDYGPAERLCEHFLVNLVFKKPFYLYGWQESLKLLSLIEDKLERTRAAATDQLAAVRELIMAIESSYCHNRQALYQLLARP